MDSNKCPKVEVANTDMQDLSYEERLKIIDTDATSLYAFCLKKGFTNNELNQCVKRLYGSPKSIKSKALQDSRNSLLFVAITVAVISMVYASPQAFKVVAAHYSLFATKVVLPYWNYGQLWDEDCLIYNEWKQEEEVVFDAKSCRFCSDIVKLNNNSFDRVTDISKTDILQYYITADQPVIVEDSMKDWNNVPLTMNILSELYQTHQLLMTSMGSCAYETNVGFNNTFYEFISAFVDGALPDKWHIRWENCDAKSAKILRKHYSRPYFIPDMAQSSASNSFVVAKGNQPDIHDLITEHDQGSWVTVVSGSVKGELFPLEQCTDKFGCKAVKFDLKAGESLLFYPQKWNMQYQITSQDETVIVSSALSWSEF